MLIGAKRAMNNALNRTYRSPSLYLSRKCLYKRVRHLYSHPPIEHGMTPAPKRLHFVAIALLAFTMIAMQVLLSRLFSVMFFYHFAFAGVTLAMLGLTAGALKVHTHPERFSLARLDMETARHCLYAAITLVISTLLLVDAPGRILQLSGERHAEGASFYVMMLFILIGAAGLVQTFSAKGVAVALLLTSFPAHTSRLYAMDLVFAAIAAVAMIVALWFLDPVSIILLLAALLAGLAWCLLRAAAPSRLRSVTVALTLLLAVTFVGQSTAYISGTPLFKVRMGKFQSLESLLFERWNTYSHVAIYPHKKKEPFGWGFGTELDPKAYTDPEQYWLKIDADAGTVLTKFDGNFNNIGYLKHDVINLGYQIRPVNDVAIIGVGGGRDILSALVFDTKQIVGIEINPAIFEALNVSFAEFTGHLDNYPQVHLINAEARSYINSRDTTYDMIQISLIDTWAATAAGGLSLSENKLYTKEAWMEFLQHLNQDGRLTVSRWFIKGKHEGELHRMVSLASDTIKTLQPGSIPRNHILVANANHIVTLILSASAFTAEEVTHFYALCERYGFVPLMAPGQSFDAITERIADGHATPAFYDSLPLKLDSPTDDQPFFFNMARFNSIIPQNIGMDFLSGNNAAIKLLSGLGLFTVLALAYTTLWPLMRLYDQQKDRFVGSTPFIFYFLCIGFGFMFVEMSIMQQLMIFLGHPVYSLSVILFTILLFSGLGSYTVRHSSLSARDYFVRPMLLCVLLISTSLLMPTMTGAFSVLPTPHRILCSVLMLIPISFCMGMMFPLGVCAASRTKADLLPWFWALNGVASVLASIIAIIVSMNYGIALTFRIGIVFYLVCFLICLFLRNGDQKQSRLAS